MLTKFLDFFRLLFPNVPHMQIKLPTKSSLKELAVLINKNLKTQDPLAKDELWSWRRTFVEVEVALESYEKSSMIDKVSYFCVYT